MSVTKVSSSANNLVFDGPRALGQGGDPARPLGLRGGVTVLTYEDWTKLLGDHFFHAGRAGQPVTFFVDDELLGRLDGSDDPDAAAAGFAGAVRSRIAPDSYGRRFNNIDRECTKWKVTGAAGFPPSLPLLAAAVLAGTRMAREEGIGKNNYWKRFRDLLDLQDSKDLKGASDVLPGLWRQLTWWLDQHHEERLGRSTVEKDEWWTIIGFALSQALFRESDRQHLTDLFRKIGLTPDESANPRELLQYFKAWAPGSPLSHGAKHMAADERYDERIVSILLDEASRWDGVLRDARGRKLGSLVLAYEPTPSPTYRLASERPEGFPDEATFTGCSYSQQLTASVEGWYAEMWPLDTRWLVEGLYLESETFVLAYRPVSVLPLARNRVLGCWASVSRVEPGEKYIVLADVHHASEVETFLATHAREEWKKETDAFAPEGWALFSGVVIEESLRDVPAGPVSVLAPKLRERPTLKGGLPLDGGVGLYLCGGEPDLWLPSLLDPDAVVLVDGVEIEGSPGQRIALGTHRLRAGSHEVNVGATTLRFTTARGLRDAEATDAGRLGHELTHDDGQYVARSLGAVPLLSEQPPAVVAISGAHLLGSDGDLPASQTTIVLPLAGRRYWVAGAKPGELDEPREPARPAWLDHAGHGDSSDALFPIGFEASPKFEAVWIVVERPGRTSVRLRQALDPSSAQVLPSLAVNEWCGLFDLEPNLDGQELELWLRYREAAAAIPKLSGEEVSRQQVAQQPAQQVAKTKVPPATAKDELVIDKLIRLPLLRRLADRHVYESVDKRFQVTHWTHDRKWTVTERRHEKSKDKERLGRFRSEEDALRAVKRAIYTIRTVPRQGTR
jgi:hypothetical protein